MSRLTRSLVVVGLALLAASCATRTVGTGVEDDVIAVTGLGKFSAAPDVALLTLGVDSNAATLAEATGDAARRMTAVGARVKSFGVTDADVATVAYSVDPRMAPADPLRRDE